jgi:hypothetical protein
MNNDPIADLPSDMYLANEQRGCPAINHFANEEMRFAFRMRYQGNVLRVWFAPEEVAAAGGKPLAKTPVGKDMWVTHDAEVLTCPPMPEEFAGQSAQLLFSGISQGVRTPNPEIAGGYIALIAQNDNIVQEPPFALDRMHASLQKQVAFNRRILKTEEEVARINSGLGDLLQDMRFSEEHPLFVCVNVGHTMRGAQPVGGQLWTQESKQITAMNKVLEGMDSSRESVTISAIAEAVGRRHELENTSDPNHLRRGQRIIVYPKFLSKFSTGMITGNVGLDMDGGHDTTDERIMDEFQMWREDCRPIFMPEDSSDIARWPALAQHAAEWMKDAKRIAVAGYGQVLEDGPDVCDSESDSENSDHGEKWSYADM